MHYLPCQNKNCESMADFLNRESAIIKAENAKLREAAGSVFAQYECMRSWEVEGDFSQLEKDIIALGKALGKE